MQFSSKLFPAIGKVAPIYLILVATGCPNDGPPVAAVPAGAETKANALVESAGVGAEIRKPVGGEQHWPHWRGPNYDGIVRERFSTDWPANGLKQVWSAKIGIGFSSMSIADGRLFSMGWSDDQETVFCFDPLTGEEKWKHTYPGKKLDNLHDGGPGATPTIDGDVVYTVGREGQLFCLKADSGEKVWEKRLGDESGVDVPEWGFTSSPLIEGELLIVDAGRTLAFNKKTGEKIWQSEVFRPGYGTAVAFDRNGERLIAMLNNDCLLILTAKEGKAVASYPWESSYSTTATTPIIDGDTIFVSSGYGRGGALLKWMGDGLDAVYDNKVMANHFNNSVLHEGHLYGISGNTHNARNGTIVCMDHATGEKKWSHRGYGVGSILIADGKCLVLSDDGQLVACEASPSEYKELAKAKILDGLCWTIPVLAGGHVYARNSAGDLVCVKLPQ